MTRPGHEAPGARSCVSEDLSSPTLTFQEPDSRGRPSRPCAGPGPVLRALRAPSPRPCTAGLVRQGLPFSSARRRGSETEGDRGKDASPGATQPSRQQQRRRFIQRPPVSEDAALKQLLAALTGSGLLGAASRPLPPFPPFPLCCPAWAGWLRGCAELGSSTSWGTSWPARCPTEGNRWGDPRQGLRCPKKGRTGQGPQWRV